MTQTLPNICEGLFNAYLRLGTTSREARVIQSTGYTACVANNGHSLNNFALNFQLNPKAVDNLVSMGSEYPGFNLIVTPMDKPDSVDRMLERAGFKHSSVLNLMVASPNEVHPVQTVEIVKAVALEDKELAADIMLDAFFLEYPDEYKEPIRASVLYAKETQVVFARWNNKIVGTALLSPFAETCGIFNFCIPREYRDKGFGGEFLKELTNYIRDLGTLPYLHCSQGLQGWYAARGFTSVGLMKIRSLA